MWAYCAKMCQESAPPGSGPAGAGGLGGWGCCGPGAAAGAACRAWTWLGNYSVGIGHEEDWQEHLVLQDEANEMPGKVQFLWFSMVSKCFKIFQNPSCSKSQNVKNIQGRFKTNNPNTSKCCQVTFLMNVDNRVVVFHMPFHQTHWWWDARGLRSTVVIGQSWSCHFPGNKKSRKKKRKKNNQQTKNIPKHWQKPRNSKF